MEHKFKIEIKRGSTFAALLCYFHFAKINFCEHENGRALIKLYFTTAQI